MARVVLITGGNAPQERLLLERARVRIGEEIGEVVAASAHYESKAWGFRAERMFWNQVLEVETSLEPEALLDAMQALENELGRNRMEEQQAKERSGERYASRSMDIDLLFYEDRIIESPRLVVPHPRIAERGFVLRPLFELMPDRRHPLLGRTVRELLEELTEHDE